MSDGALEVVDRIWEAYEREGIAGMIGLVAPHCVFEEYGGGPEAATYTGPEGMAEMAAKWGSDFDDVGFERQGDSVALGQGFVATPVRMVGKGRASGIAVEWPLIQGNRIQDGLLTNQFYADDVDGIRARMDEILRRAAPS